MSRFARAPLQDSSQHRIVAHPPWWHFVSIPVNVAIAPIDTCSDDFTFAPDAAIIFKALGILVGAYAAYAAVRGEVFARSDVWGRTVSRTQSPTYFWIVIGIYAGLSLALSFLF